MAGISTRQALAGEDVAQVCAAGGAGYLSPIPVGIGRAAHRACYLLVKARPTASGMEFICRPVDRCIAPSAQVNAVFEQPVVFPAEGRLGPLMQDYVFLPGQKAVILHESKLMRPGISIARYLRATKAGTGRFTGNIILKQLWYTGNL